jgi:hypothetical protein
MKIQILGAIFVQLLPNTIKKVRKLTVCLLLLWPIFLFAQKYEVTVDTILIEGQKEGFIAGLEPIRIVVSNVMYDKSEREFFIIGYVDNYRADFDSGLVDIDLKRKGATYKRRYYTGHYGSFKAKLKKDDCLVFYGGIYEGYLTVKGRASVR